MSEGFVQLPPDSSGKKTRTLEAIVGSNVVEQQVVVLGSGGPDNTVAFVDPSTNALKVAVVSGDISTSSVTIATINTTMIGGTLTANSVTAVIQSITSYQGGTWSVAITNPTTSLTAFISNSITASTKIPLSATSPRGFLVDSVTGIAVASNPNRKGLVLVNTSNNYISLGIGYPAILYCGITLNPQGGTWVLDEFTFTTGQITAIASMSGSQLAIQEFN